jgi:hypothetical protein
MLVGLEVLQAVILKGFIIWDMMPYSALAGRQAASYAGFLVGLLFNPDAMCFSKMSVDFQQTTHSYIPEDGTLCRYVFPYELHCHTLLSLWKKFPITLWICANMSGLFRRL